MMRAITNNEGEEEENRGNDLKIAMRYIDRTCVYKGAVRSRRLGVNWLYINAKIARCSRDVCTKRSVKVDKREN